MADTADNIGYYTTGAIPIRAHQETHDGTLPLPGWLSEYDCKGYIQEDMMPYSINPKMGYIVSCNQKIVDETKYPYFLGCAYSDGFRAQRAIDMINEKISKQEKVDLQYCEKMQLDIIDYSAREVMGILEKLDMLSYIEKELKNIDFSKIRNELAFKNVRQIANKNEYYKSEQSISKCKYLWDTLINSKWDFTLSVDSHNAALYTTLFYCLTRNIVTTGVLTGYIQQLEQSN